MPQVLLDAKPTKQCKPELLSVTSESWHIWILVPIKFNIIVFIPPLTSDSGCLDVVSMVSASSSVLLVHKILSYVLYGTSSLKLS